MTGFYFCHLMNVGSGSHWASCPGVSGLILFGLPLVFQLRVSVSVEGFASLHRDPPEAWVRLTALEGTSKRNSLERVECFKPLNQQFEPS
jgi:hypothetical protein